MNKTNIKITLSDQYSILIDNPSFVIGVLFMFSFLLLLIYANYGDRITIRRMVIRLLKLPVFSCFKRWIIIRKKSLALAPESDASDEHRNLSNEIPESSISYDMRTIYVNEIDRTNTLNNLVTNSEVELNLNTMPFDLKVNNLLKSNCIDTTKNENAMWV